MRFIVGLFALSCFALSLIVHVQALNGVDVADYAPAVWLLHIGVFLSFGPFVYCARRDNDGNLATLTLAKQLPVWVAFLGGIVFVYALLNFALFMNKAGAGSASIEHGQYVLKDHARFIRELTADEYHAFKANELRGFSGHWMLFYFIPAAYFLFRKPAVSSS